MASSTPYPQHLPYAIDVLPDAIIALNNLSTKRVLSSNYQPGEFDVVCGRGKGSYNRPGNRKFRALVASSVPQYLSSKSKIDRSLILNAIIDEFRLLTNSNGCPAQFVKYETGTGWTEIGDQQARQKVGHALREAISQLS